MWLTSSGGLQPEISSPEETKGTLDRVRPETEAGTGRGEVALHLKRVCSSSSWLPELLGLGKAQNAGPTESAPLWSTREPEPERLTSGSARNSGPAPCRATWSLSSIDRESTHAVSRGKPSVAETLQALPTHSSDICLQRPSLPTAQLNKRT